MGSVGTHTSAKNANVSGTRPPWNVIECLRALTAAETLVNLADFSESLAFDLAIVARHFGLAFFGPTEPK
jgi:hypothetical protein